MKMKIKNEFQNPDLIFGNEIQKQKLKTINEILKSITIFVFVILLLVITLLDSNNSIPYIVLLLCIIWFLIYLVIKFKNKY